MKVSIIVPVYNGGHVLRRTLDSICVQSMSDFEFICVDDGSNDGGRTTAILNEYALLDKRCRILHQRNKGPDAAQAYALSVAEGDYVIRCDQDDIMHPDELKYCITCAERFNLDFLSFRYERFQGTNPPVFHNIMTEIEELKIWNKKTMENDRNGYCLALCHVHTDTWSHFVRRDLARAAPLGPEFEFTRPFWQIKNAENWASSTEKLYFYNEGNESSMSRKIPSRKNFINKRLDLVNLYMLFNDMRREGDIYGTWKTISRCFVASRVKHMLGKIRRCARATNSVQITALKEELALMIWTVFHGMKVSMCTLRLRHRIVCLYMLWRYRKFIATMHKQCTGLC